MSIITIIGSTGYQDKVKKHAEELREEGHEVLIPAFDSKPDYNELEICAYNKELIRRASEVHVIWDARSNGTIFDLGMAFAMNKPIKIIHLNEKTIVGFTKQYEKRGPSKCKKCGCIIEMEELYTTIGKDYLCEFCFTRTVDGS